MCAELDLDEDTLAIVSEYDQRLFVFLEIIYNLIFAFSNLGIKQMRKTMDDRVAFLQKQIDDERTEFVEQVIILSYVHVFFSKKIHTKKKKKLFKDR